MQSGLFVTFFNENEPRDRELPPVGPLDHVVLRHGPQLIAERTTAHHADQGVPLDRWFEAELELQRATGEEPGGTRRSQMRFTARDGLYVRFVSYGDAQESHRLAELGPYNTVIARGREIEADGRLIATLAVADFPTWALSAITGEGFAGAYKPDLAIRAEGAKYHPSLGPTPTTSEPQPVRPAAPPPRAGSPAREVQVVPHHEPERSEDTLRARIFEENRQRAGADSTGEPAAWTPHARTTSAVRPRAAKVAVPAEDGFSVGEALWRWRFAIIGVLLVGMVTYAAYIAIRSAAPSSAQHTTVNVGQRFTGTGFDWTVSGVQRAPTAGAARAQGTFYVVNVAAVNRGGEGAAASPGDFTLIDANGVSHGAERFTSAAYQGPSNASSPYVWPTSFPPGRTVMFVVIFDVEGSLARGNQLGVADAPTIRVRLD